jgi:hypothetical protein
MNKERAEYVTRDAIMSLLSDDEVAQASTAETAPRLSDGDQYIDLENLERGVQTSVGGAVVMGRVLTRTSIGDGTWAKVVAQLSALTPPRAHSPA